MRQSSGTEVFFFNWGKVTGKQRRGGGKSFWKLEQEKRRKRARKGEGEKERGREAQSGKETRGS